MDIYVIKSQNGSFYKRAFTSFENAEEVLVYTLDPNYYIEKVKVKGNFRPGRNVYFVDVYYGFDYDMMSTFDVTSVSRAVYTCKEAAKLDDLWTSCLAKVDGTTHFYDDHICSDDGRGNDWTYGDVMEGKFNARIRKIRLDKSEHKE